MRVMVAENDPRVRKALNMLLNLEPELTIEGECTDSASLLAQAQEVHPDLVLLDWELPGSSITEVIERLREINDSCKVIVFCRRAEAKQSALTVGADAFFSKTHPADSLLETLHTLFGTHERNSVDV